LISNNVNEALADTEILIKSLGGFRLDGKAETEELHEVIWNRPANPRELDSTSRKAILRPIGKDPAKRFQSVENLQAAIPNERPSHKIAPTVWRDAPWTVLGLAVAAVILIVLAIVLLSRGMGNRQAVDTTPSDAEFAAFRMAESLDTQQSWGAFLK